MLESINKSSSNFTIISQVTNNYPSWLEYLTTIDELLVHQKVEIWGTLTNFDTKNQYSIKNNLGEELYCATEDSGCFSKNCCRDIRPFDMTIADNLGNSVIYLYRQSGGITCCFPCGLQKMEVSSPPNTLIGTIEQKWTFGAPLFEIKNENGEVNFFLEGPICPMCRWNMDVKFNILSADEGKEIGEIARKWPEVLRDLYTDEDVFGVTFPIDLDVRMKAVMLGACILMDLMFFKSNQDD